MHQFTERVAIITGAASGIGLAIADRLATEGAYVVLADLDGEAAARAADGVRPHGGEVESLELDVRDPDAVERAADWTVERFGGLHIGVNNAGIVNGGLSWELSIEDWHKVMDVNLWGVIHGVRAFVPRILATGAEGHIVNVASMAAVYALPKLGPYTVAKHGVLGLSDVLRVELAALAPEVGVSTVFPGGTRTGMNPIGTVEPATVAANVVDAIRKQRPYVFTDHQATEQVNARLESIIAARAQVLS